MKTFNENIKRYLNTYKGQQDIKKAYIIDGKYVLTNAYSIIVLPLSANKNNFKRLTELDIEQIKDNDEKEKNMIEMLKKHVATFENNHFCEPATIKNQKENNIEFDNSDITFDNKKIKQIQKVIDGKSIFTSKENERAICLTGKNGYAWLLGQVKY